MSFLDELYYGNINPNENRNRKPLPYEKAVRTFSDTENKLTKELNGEKLKLFNEPVNVSDEISAASGVENFIGDILTEVQNGLGYADARAKSNRIFFN